MKRILTGLFVTLISASTFAETNHSGAYAGPDNSYFQITHIPESNIVIATALANDLTYNTFLGQMIDNTNTANLETVLSGVNSTVLVEFLETTAVITVTSCTENDDFYCVFPVGFSFTVNKIL